MANYRSSIGPQLAAFEQNVKRMVRGALLQCSRNARARMVRERLSGPPGVYKKTGRLRRSQQYKTHVNGAKVRLEGQIGGPIAPYAKEHEDRGRLGFRRIFREEAEKTVDAIRTGFSFLAKNAGVAGVDVGFSLPSAGTGRAAELEELASRFDPELKRGRLNIAKRDAAFKRATAGLNKKVKVHSGGRATPTGEFRRAILKKEKLHYLKRKEAAAYRRKFAKLKRKREKRGKA